MRRLERWQARPAHWRALDRTTPILDGQALPLTTKVGHDKVDRSGTVTLRCRSKLHHRGLRRAKTGRRVLVLVRDLHIRVTAEDGDVLRRSTPDPSVDDQTRSRATV
ncbi:MAG: hypothetical protein ACLQPH_15145 [Acidimicrobiales bacterium]